MVANSELEFGASICRLASSDLQVWFRARVCRGRKQFWRFESHEEARQEKPEEENRCVNSLLLPFR